MLEIKGDFPIFSDNKLCYLDSASSAQKPKCVIEEINNSYAHAYANIHRGVYPLSIEATERFEHTRNVVQHFINAASTKEIVFTKGATEAINLVAYSWGMTNVKPNDSVVVSILEHHSNFVPWQRLCEKQNAAFVCVKLESDHTLSAESVARAITKKTKLLAITYLSNGLGIKTPIKDIIKIAHDAGSLVLVDAAQAVAHCPIDVQDLDCDFLVFSAHKIYGPAGVGALYAKEALLEAMPPFLSGGDMIRSVSETCTTLNDLPHKFEAGTPDMIGVAAFAKALQYVNDLGWQNIVVTEQLLVKRLEEVLLRKDKIKVLGPIGQHHGLVSFVAKNIHHHDLAQLLSKYGVCVRAGHHCAQPLINYLGYEGSIRASVGAYNTVEDIDRFQEALEKALSFF
ncbi:MAG: cysteine desulfurase [Deltaproteobacteria bacterium]|nr:cysteine desulfurase [Deltaproteobacteria bacterium]